MRLNLRTRAVSFVLTAIVSACVAQAAQVDDEARGSEALRRDAVDFVLALDAAAAPECVARSVAKVEVISAEDPGGASRERWSIDRCGVFVEWDIRYEPSAAGTMFLGVGLAAPDVESPGPAERTEARDRRPEAKRAGTSPRSGFVVTHASDSGPGSLRQAILDANASPNDGGPDLIRFDIPSAGPHVIVLLAPLPEIKDPVILDATAGEGGLESAVELDGSRIAGSSHGLVVTGGSSTVRGLRIFGFTGDAIRIEGAGSNTVEGNVLGGGPDAREGRWNAGSGIAVVDSPDNTIGGSVPSAHNVLAGNGEHGVRISGAGAIGNTILGNRIVRNVSGGIELEPPSSDIAEDVPAGPNKLQRAPELSIVAFTPEGATVEGVFEGRPSASYRIEWFATSAGVRSSELAGSSEGDRLVASAEVVPGADGRAAFRLLVPEGIRSRDRVTATATDAEGNTSEFSAAILAPAVVISWAAGTGNWGTAANWNPAQLPGAGDDVVIAANGANTTFTVTLDVAATVNSLTLGGGNGTQTLAIGTPTLTLNGPSTVAANGVLAHSGGTLAGTGNLVINGTYNWSGGVMTGAGITTVNGPFNLSGVVGINANRTLNNASTANWTSAAGLGIRTGTGSIINNSGTWDAQTGDGAAIVNYYGGAAPTFSNSGTFRKSVGAGTTAVNIAFTNTGTVDVQTGTLSLGGGGSSTNALNVSGAAATLLFPAATFDLNAGTTFSGPGTVSLNSVGSLNVNAAVSTPASTRFTFVAGTLGGTGTLTTNGPFDWSGGVMTGAGITTVNGPFNLSGVVGINANRTLNNASTANWTSAAGLGIRTGTGSIINNSGTWVAQTGDGAAIVNYYGGAAPTFNNSGTFRKSVGAGTTAVNIAFANTGTVDVQTGTLSLGGGGSSTNALNVSGAAATLLFQTATFNLNAGTTISGPGTVSLNSVGSLNVNAAISTPASTRFTFLAGTLAGTGTLTTNGPFDWSGGLMTGAGITTVNGPFNLSGVVGINANRTLNNASTANWTSAAGLGIRTGTGSIINNSGTWDAQTGDGAAIVNYYGGAAPTFNNSGTFRKSIGAGTTAVNIAFANTGTVDVQTGSLNVTGNYAQTAGITKLTGGALTSTTNIAIQGGTLAGTGTVTGPVVISGTGALAPGLSPGTVNVVGNYTQQNPSGAFNVEIGGTAPGTQFDNANVSGTGAVASLAGALNVSLISGFVPTPGHSFTILTYPSRVGTFSTVNLPAITCQGWTVDYGPTSTVLSTYAVPSEVSGLNFASNKVDLQWSSRPGGPARTYDVLRGVVREFPVGTGPGETCLAQSISGTSTPDSTTPLSGKGFWYLTRERAAGCGIGTYGIASNGTERIGTACP